MATDTNTKQHILEAFQQLFEARKPFPSRMAIREEVAEKARDKRVVETVSTYTVESVVKGLAELQLHFGTDIDGLAARLSTEIRKLEDVRRAIEVETRHFEELRHIKIAAEALNILTQEHQETGPDFCSGRHTTTGDPGARNRREAASVAERAGRARAVRCGIRGGVTGKNVSRRKRPISMGWNASGRSRPMPMRRKSNR